MNDFEIEMRAVLSKEKYEELARELPKKVKLINQETLITEKFLEKEKQIDIRFRHSEKRFEIVCKKGKDATMSRQEITIPLISKKEGEHFLKILELLELKRVPPWTTHRNDYEYEFKDYNYSVSLQHVENFEYILEVEYFGEEHEKEVQEPILKEIIESFGCKPTSEEEIRKKVKQYIKEN
ncbi:hypothetical protein H8D36_07020 [archaeon]|nr:hypothetical protein [archaeon]MBL7057652.1 hypothetical protein [Candidatus Woesearchaeota archaeon]